MINLMFRWKPLRLLHFIFFERASSLLQLVFEASTRSYYYNDYHSSISKHVCDGYGYTAFDDVYVYNTSCNGKFV